MLYIQYIVYDTDTFLSTNSFHFLLSSSYFYLHEIIEIAIGQWLHVHVEYVSTWLKETIRNVNLWVIFRIWYSERGIQRYYRFNGLSRNVVFPELEVWFRIDSIQDGAFFGNTWLEVREIFHGAIRERRLQHTASPHLSSFVPSSPSFLPASSGHVKNSLC